MAVRMSRQPSLLRAVRSRLEWRTSSDVLIGLISLAILIIGAIIFSIPFIWLMSTALKSREQLFKWPPVWIPNPIMWENFPNAWNYATFDVYLVNTLIITITAMIGTVLSSSLVGFGFARLRFPGREFLFLCVVATLMLPYVVTLIPVYILFAKLGWVNTFLPLIVPSFFGGGAFNIFLMRQFFRTIPKELEDAARIDGAATWHIWWIIFLPLSRPAVATVAIFSFMHHWNDFLAPLIYLNDQKKYTLAIGLQQFLSEHTAEWDLLMAASAMMTLPLVVVFFFAQRYFIQGIVMTGLKG